MSDQIILSQQQYKSHEKFEEFSVILKRKNGISFMKISSSTRIIIMIYMIKNRPNNLTNILLPTKHEQRGYQKNWKKRIKLLNLTKQLLHRQLASKASWMNIIGTILLVGFW